MSALPFKPDAPFYIGSTDIFDFQRITGFRRWNTWLSDVAAQKWGRTDAVPLGERSLAQGGRQ